MDVSQESGFPIGCQGCAIAQPSPTSPLWKQCWRGNLVLHIHGNPGHAGSVNGPVASFQHQLQAGVLEEHIGGHCNSPHPYPSPATSICGGGFLSQMQLPKPEFMYVSGKGYSSHRNPSIPLLAPAEDAVFSVNTLLRKICKSLN